MKIATREITIPARAARTALMALTYVGHNVGRSLECSYAEGVVKGGEFVPDLSTVKTFAFSGKDYERLYEAAPAWSPSKPAGTWKESDLFDLMEYIQSGRAELDDKSKLTNGGK